MKRKRTRRSSGGRPPNTNYMMKGMMDMNTMAVSGVVTAGTIGVIGSILKT